MNSMFSVLLSLGMTFAFSKRASRSWDVCLIQDIIQDIIQDDIIQNIIQEHNPLSLIGVPCVPKARIIQNIGRRPVLRFFFTLLVCDRR